MTHEKNGFLRPVPVSVEFRVVCEAVICLHNVMHSSKPGSCVIDLDEKKKKFNIEFDEEEGRGREKKERPASGNVWFCFIQIILCMEYMPLGHDLE